MRQRQRRSYKSWPPRQSKSRFYGGGRGQPRSIDIAAFISRTQSEQLVPEQEVKRTFAEVAVDIQVKTNIAKRGYVKPTPIQDQVIDLVLAGRDVLGIANTGTGKTGAFLIPTIHKILGNRDEKMLIVVPTRELAVQIEQEFIALARNLNIRSALCIGGTNMGRQSRDLSQNLNVVIGTPGRLKDVIERRMLYIGGYQTVVLDEVDHMLDMGFIHDMRAILSRLPVARQSLFFSATVPLSVMKLIGEFSCDLVPVSVKTMETAAGIRQEVIQVMSPEHKMSTLHDLLISKGFDKVLIFGRTKHGVNKLSRRLFQRGFRVESIHGNRTQPQRERALLKFRRDQVNILVATDLAARGLDINNVTHVINFDVPASYDDYVHRIGRTGRANNKGLALTLVGG